MFEAAAVTRRPTMRVMESHVVADHAAACLAQQLAILLAERDSRYLEGIPKQARTVHDSCQSCPKKIVLDGWRYDRALARPEVCRPDHAVAKIAVILGQ